VHDGASNAVGTGFGLDLGFASPKCLVCAKVTDSCLAPPKKGPGRSGAAVFDPKSSSRQANMDEERQASRCSMDTANHVE
jgi:hypothetical protein